MAALRQDIHCKRSYVNLVRSGALVISVLTICSASVELRGEVSELCVEYAELLGEAKSEYDRRFDPKRLRKERKRAYLNGYSSSSNGSFGGAGKSGSAAKDAVEQRQEVEKREALESLMDMQFQYQKACGQ